MLNIRLRECYFYFITFTFLMYLLATFANFYKLLKNFKDFYKETMLLQKLRDTSNMQK